MKVRSLPGVLDNEQKDAIMHLTKEHDANYYISFGGSPNKPHRGNLWLHGPWSRKTPYTGRRAAMESSRRLIIARVMHREFESHPSYLTEQIPVV